MYFIGVENKTTYTTHRSRTCKRGERDKSNLYIQGIWPHLSRGFSKVTKRQIETFGRRGGGVGGGHVKTQRTMKDKREGR